jgi:hypothetical protein
MWAVRSTDMSPPKGLGFHVGSSIYRHSAPKGAGVSCGQFDLQTIRSYGAMSSSVGAECL